MLVLEVRNEEESKRKATKATKSEDDRKCNSNMEVDFQTTAPSKKKIKQSKISDVNDCQSGKKMDSEKQNTTGAEQHPARRGALTTGSRTQRKIPLVVQDNIPTTDNRVLQD